MTLVGSLPGSITIPAGSLSADATTTFRIRAIDNNQTQGDKTITLGGTAAGFTVTAMSITLADDDTPSTSLTLTVDAELAAGMATRRGWTRTSPAIPTGTCR